jgi:hypothetical protein
MPDGGDLCGVAVILNQVDATCGGVPGTRGVRFALLDYIALATLAPQNLKQIGGICHPVAIWAITLPAIGHWLEHGAGFPQVGSFKNV